MAYSAGIVRAAEETEARTIFRDPENRADSPDYECASYREQIGDVKLVRAVFGGSKTMRAEKQRFLPKHPLEEPTAYEDRLKIARAYNALQKTVEGLSGMIFRRDPTVDEDMPELVKDHLEDIDRRGNKLAVFLHHVADDALLDGHAWVHVEAPPTEGFRNEQEADAAGVRPYWIRIKKAQAINWRYEIRAGRPILTLFVYREGVSQPVGEFGEESRQRVRVLREGALDEMGVRGPVRGELWELRRVQRGSAEREEWVRIKEYQVGVSEVPVVFVPSKEAGEFSSSPPLLDLAEEQIEHYRVRSDRQKNMTFASISVPYVFGQRVTDEQGNAQVKWGPGGMLLLNDPEASAGVIESQGFGLESTRDELAAIKENMASLGLRMLVRPTGVQPTTATAELLGKSESSASLAQFAITLEDATNRLLEIHGDYEGVDQPGSVRINKSFFKQLLSPEQIRAWGDEVARGHLSLDTMWQLLIEGEGLPDDFDPEEERARIEQDGAAGLGALEAAMGAVREVEGEGGGDDE